MNCPRCDHELQRISFVGDYGIGFRLSCHKCGYDSSEVLESEIYAMLEKRIVKHAKLLKEVKGAKR